MLIRDMMIEVLQRSDSDPLSGTQSQFRRVEYGLLRVTTDDGLEGNAYVPAFINGRLLFDPILRIIKPLLLGRDASLREWLAERLAVLRAGRVVPTEAWAPVDVALWDIAGKAAGRPICELIGEARDEVDVYATYPARFDCVEAFIEEAEVVKDRGFTAYKIHPGSLPRHAVGRLVGDVRDCMGDGAALMLDPNSGYEFSTALYVGKALDAYGFYWFEDPIEWNDFDSIVDLARRLDTPLSISDHPEFRLREAAHYVRLNAIRALRGGTHRIGITGLKKLCALTESFGLQCEIGTSHNSIMDMANLQVMLATANSRYFEWWMPEKLRQFGVSNELSLSSDMTLKKPSGAGLGCELDESWIRSHLVTSLD